MRFWIVFLLWGSLSTSVVAQSTQTKFLPFNRSNFLSEFSQPDSVDARSILFFNYYAYQKAKYGLLGATLGGGLGAFLIWLKTRDRTYCDLGCVIAYSTATLGGGLIGFSLGVWYASNRFREDAGRRIHTQKRYVKFRKIGATFETGGTESYMALVLRRLPRAFYLPSTAQWYYYTFDGTFDYESTTASNGLFPTAFVYGKIKGSGFRLQWVDYQRVLGGLLGLEVGWHWGNLTENQDGVTRSKSVSVPNVQMAFGSHLNLIQGLSITAMYRYRLYGPVDALRPQGFRTLSKRYSYLLGIVFYFH